ncbi:MAG: FkbM family methyltransferase [Gammaproteobacteria bacterium]
MEGIWANSPFLRGLYNRLKASAVYDLYWNIRDRKVLQARSREIEFYRGLLCGFHKGDLIFDIGANHGYKIDIFLRLGASVVAVDPDKVNQEILRQKFLSYRLSRKPVVLVDKAVSSCKGVQTLWIDEPGSAKNTLSRKWVSALKNDNTRFGKCLTFNQNAQIETVTLADLINEHGQPFFVKIDVEGHELDVLKGLRHPVPYLSFEVNLPDFREEGIQCIKVLGDLAADGVFNYSACLEKGLSLETWLEMSEFLTTFTQCSDKSIEVFWKTTFVQ